MSGEEGRILGFAESTVDELPIREISEQLSAGELPACKPEIVSQKIMGVDFWEQQEGNQPEWVEDFLSREGGEEGGE